MPRTVFFGLSVYLNCKGYMLCLDAHVPTTTTTSLSVLAQLAKQSHFTPIPRMA